MISRVLIADDHEAIGLACRRMLEADFDAVSSVSGGVAALEAIAADAPDLLILDIEMPDLSGLEVLERLQHLSPRPCVIVLTQHVDVVLADRAQELGALGFVAKARMARDLRPAIEAAQSGESFRSPLAS